MSYLGHGNGAIPLAVLKLLRVIQVPMQGKFDTFWKETKNNSCEAKLSHFYSSGRAGL